MTEPQRAKQIQAIQLRLFELSAETKQMKFTLLTLLAGITKRCNECREEMGTEQFYVDTRYSDNLYPVCRECKNRKNLRRYHASSYNLRRRARYHERKAAA